MENNSEKSRGFQLPQLGQTARAAALGALLLGSAAPALGANAELNLSGTISASQEMQQDGKKMQQDGKKMQREARFKQATARENLVVKLKRVFENTKSKNPHLSDDQILSALKTKYPKYKAYWDEVK